jgi:uncharacterized membrane protein YkoI
MKFANRIAVTLGVLGLVVGIGASMAAQSYAQTSTDPAITTAVTTTTAAQDAPRDQSKGGHVGSNGTKEELLTGTTAEKATAAALAAVPGGTIDRVETDAEGAAYEAHMTKADGTRVTVKMDTNFAVTAIENGPQGR